MSYLFVSCFCNYIDHIAKTEKPRFAHCCPGQMYGEDYYVYFCYFTMLYQLLMLSNFEW